MSKHTPGPWTNKYFDRVDAKVSGKYGEFPVAVLNKGLDECAANARLIAAAPEMLAKLEELHRLRFMDVTADNYAYIMEQLQTIEVLIAKATGGTP